MQTVFTAEPECELCDLHVASACITYAMPRVWHMGFGGFPPYMETHIPPIRQKATMAKTNVFGLSYCMFPQGVSTVRSPVLREGK